MRRRICAVPTWGALGLLGLGLLGGCGEGAGPEAGLDDRAQPGTLRRAIRPTDGEGWLGNGYEKDAVIRHYDPPGEHFRVYYALNGQSAVDLTDVDPMDGVPDFVNLVGTAAEATETFGLGAAALARLARD